MNVLLKLTCIEIDNEVSQWPCTSERISGFLVEIHHHSPREDSQDIIAVISQRGFARISDISLLCACMWSCMCLTDLNSGSRINVIVRFENKTLSDDIFAPPLDFNCRFRMLLFGGVRNDGLNIRWMLNVLHVHSRIAWVVSPQPPHQCRTPA